MLCAGSSNLLHPLLTTMLCADPSNLLHLLLTTMLCAGPSNLFPLLLTTMLCAGPSNLLHPLLTTMLCALGTFSLTTDNHTVCRLLLEEILMESTNVFVSLPSHGVPSFISEVLSCQPSSVTGKTVRVVGKVELYSAADNQAVLSEPKKSGRLLVDTHLTDAADFRLGSHVMLIGELQAATGSSGYSECFQESKSSRKSGGEASSVGDTDSSVAQKICEPKCNSGSDHDQHVFLTARVSQCVDRLDYSQYCQAVHVWRKFSKEKL
ncbi:hypothetical protein PoB_003529400 [Plakobranchus ocellatus]|uniref:Uncharacterized protein n=1 Tax=Plakobranchus ocellatus TaxID=259542 RepID=A0AAV4ARM6_9GAST|nr:hypothetical protein PoB_003529400 [Plakobranchus ocellatus]